MFVRQTSNLIKKYIQPLMEEYRFTLSFKDKKIYSFEKKYTDLSGDIRKQIITFDVLTLYPVSAEAYLYFSIKIEPSFIYRDIDLNSIFKTDNCRIDSLSARWSYWDMNDFIQILNVISNRMKEKGFSFIDECSKDPDDVIPTLEEQKHLLLHHESYLKDFCNTHNINMNCIDDILDIINQTLDLIPSKSAGAHRKEIIMLAAALGQVYEMNGGIWEFDNRNNCVRVVIYNKKLPVPPNMPKIPCTLVYPIDFIWDSIQHKDERRADIKTYILSDLKDLP